METSLLGVVWSVPNVAVVVVWAFLLLARGQHALKGYAYRRDAQHGAPLGPEDRGADVAVRINVRMNGRLVLVVHYELDGRRRDGILAVEAELEHEGLSLVEALPKNLDGEEPRLEIVRTEEVDADRASLCRYFC